jgi:hypothetical protein
LGGIGFDGKLAQNSFDAPSPYVVRVGISGNFLQNFLVFSIFGFGDSPFVGAVSHLIT